MYTPSVAPPRNENPPSSTHLHGPDQTLTEHEDSQNFKTYLNGRTSAYEHVTQHIQASMNTTTAQLKRYQHDPVMRALIEGQLEGLKEILQLVKNSQERNGPTA